MARRDRSDRPTQNVNVYAGGPPFPHTFHLLMTLLTCGLWFPIWFLTWLLYRR